LQVALRRLLSRQFGQSEWRSFDLGEAAGDRGDVDCLAELSSFGHAFNSRRAKLLVHSATTRDARRDVAQWCIDPH
jgi:hypothetical protein